MRRKGLSFDDVVAMTADQPDVEEHVWYRTRALRIGKLSFARLKEDGVSMVLLVDGDDAKEALLTSNPRVFFTTPHYDGYPYVLVRLAEATRRDLAPLLDSIREVAARRKPPRGASTKKGAPAKATKSGTAKAKKTADAAKSAKSTEEQAPFARVHAIVARIPRGKVVTYGQISQAIDRRLTPVGVGWALRAAVAGALPWHRVVNAHGGISTDAEHHGLQRALLEAEGVAFGPDLRVDLARYGWRVPPMPAARTRSCRSLATPAGVT